MDQTGAPIDTPVTSEVILAIKGLDITTSKLYVGADNDDCGELFVSVHVCGKSEKKTN